MSVERSGIWGAGHDDVALSVVERDCGHLACDGDADRGGALGALDKYRAYVEHACSSPVVVFGRPTQVHLTRER